MAEAGKVPVQESVGAALRFLRENFGFVAAGAGIGAAGLTLVAVASLQAPMLGLPLALLSTFVGAFVYAAFTRGALSGASAVNANLLADGGRVWASMAIVGFFLFIVFVVLAIPGMIMLGVMIGPRYLADLQAAQGDDAASLDIMGRIASENPVLLLGFALFYAALWLALTSRLYLAAPASADMQRILTFETWKWTKGNMLRIMGARLMLLGPAYVLVNALAYLAGVGLGLNVMDPVSTVAFAQSNVALYAVFSFAVGFIQILIYRGLEAGLSAYLYRGLKQQDVSATFS